MSPVPSASFIGKTDRGKASSNARSPHARVNSIPPRTASKRYGCFVSFNPSINNGKYALASSALGSTRHAIAFAPVPCATRAGISPASYFCRNRVRTRRGCVVAFARDAFKSVAAFLIVSRALRVVDRPRARRRVARCYFCRLDPKTSICFPTDGGT
jgi:hypothetical protein